MADASDTLPAGTDDLLRQVGIALPLHVTRLSGGANNRVFAAEGSCGACVLVKAYFHDAEDQRDRLGAEYGFLTAATGLGLTCIARPLACSTTERIGIYSFLNGAAATARDVTPDALQQALDFVLRVNSRDQRRHLPRLPPASEACWTANDHIANITIRIKRLAHGTGETAIERDARAFMRDVEAFWQRLQAHLKDHLSKIGVDPAQPVAETERILSPSDFGFHNALKTADGQISFVDFEYAGWDDPAKLVCDAFNQVRIPLPHDFYPSFRDAIAAWTGRPEIESRRYDLFMPAYGVKWVTTMLNEFIPVSQRRRAFAGNQKVDDDKRAAQLAAARTKFAEIAW